MRSDTGSVQQGSDAHRLELLVDAVTEYAIYMLDHDGFITSWNTGAERIKGYSAAEIMGQHFFRFFTTDDQASRVPERIMAEARATGRCEAEGWRVRKDGSRFWANAVLHLMRDEHGSPIGFAEITRDMTERMVSQEAMREQDRRFRLLVEGVVDYAIYMLDPSGVVTNWNRGAERLKGYTADEIIGQHFSRFYTKEERAIGMPARILDTAAREGRYEAEGWRVRKDGSRFWASVVVDAIRNPAGRLEGFAKVTRDITERRAAQDTLRESERQFRLLVAGVTDYALYMLDPNGIVVSWNAGAERIKGYKADQIIGQHFSRFYTERDRAAGLPARALYIATQEGRFEAEGLRVRKDGVLFWANVVIDPIRDEKGNLIGFAKITRDITERRNAQKALQESEAQRAQAQKMDALGKLTGGVAHDFNNMLMVVSGYIQTLKKKVADDPKASRAAELIELAAKRAATLTRQLLTFSRRQTINPTVVSPGQQVEAFRPVLASSLSGSLRFISTIGPEVWTVKVDASEFEFALVNLVLNARDATPSGGLISITAENVTLRRPDTKAGIEGEFVAVRVTDTGSGIAPDVLPNVFDPFFTTKQGDKGSGLGLSQVHGFAHQSGGTVTIETQLGKGTTFTIYLPRANEEAVDTKIEPALERSVGGTVLLVEDNPEVAEVTVSMLKELGYEVHAVSGPTAALEAIDKQSFDLVISDVVMPDVMDGLALARTLRERKPGVPVLLVTGYSEAGAEAVAEFTVMRKPFQLADLNRITARMIAESKQPPGTNVVRLHPRPVFSD
jgi:PAS domain S-box-containing protein